MADDLGPVASSFIPDLVGNTVDNGRLCLRSVLGRGAWGVVYLAETTGTSPGEKPDRYAVKCILTREETSLNHQTTIAREVSLLRKCSKASSNVLKLHDVLDKEHTDLLFLVTDYCDGDLLDAILSGRFVGQNELVKSIFLQLLDAVEACHDLNVFHRDIKPENILLMEGGTKAVLADFGFATDERYSREFRVGSEPFMSPGKSLGSTCFVNSTDGPSPPECLGGLEHLMPHYSSAQSDVWALGVVLVNLACGCLPWAKAEMADAGFKTYVEYPYNYFHGNFRISKELSNLLMCIFTPNPRDRMSIGRLRERIKMLTVFGTKKAPKPRRLFQWTSKEVPASPKPQVKDEQSDAQQPEPADIHIEDGIVEVRVAHPATEPPLASYLVDDSFMARCDTGSASSIAIGPLLDDSSSSTLSGASSNFVNGGQLSSSSTDSEPESVGPITPAQFAADAAAAAVPADLEGVPSLTDGENMGQGLAATLAFPAQVLLKAEIGGEKQKYKPKFWKRNEPKTATNIMQTGNQPSRLFRNAAKLVGNLIRIRSREKLTFVKPNLESHSAGAANIPVEVAIVAAPEAAAVPA
ncbi:kinase-like protein [Rickenella mellea]|uniref:non-specific serine/threonine protein kinase n=1 Tax=Rickenella mellea TaxID=50990 RepID=A0A4Y7QBA3_9AGAM|nr:kinase-like protein [Rickenella mellea]